MFPVYELHVSTDAGCRLRTNDPRAVSSAFEHARLWAEFSHAIVTLYVDRDGAGLVPERRYSGAEHARMKAARRAKGMP